MKRGRPVHMRAIPKELRDLAKAAQEAGWFISTAGHTHTRWLAPSGVAVYCPTSPSTKNVTKYMAVRLKRAGLPLSD